MRSAGNYLPRYNVFYSLAVSLTGVTVSAVLLNIAPVFTAIISGLLFHEKITPWKICALLVNIVGCVLAATGGQVDIIIISLTGILCGVGAGFCYSMTAIIGRLSGEKSNPFVTSTYSYLFAAIFLAVFAKPWQGTISINYHVYLIGFLYALIPTAIAYLLYYRGVQLISNVSQVPVLASVETIVAGILGVSLFHDTLTITSLVGILLVLMSIVLMSSHKFDK